MNRSARDAALAGPIGTGTAPARAYDFHGIRLAVTGWEPAAAAVHARLDRLPAGAPDDPGDNPAGLRFEFLTGGEAAALARHRPQGGRPVYDPPQGEVLYSEAEDLLYIEHGEDRRMIAVCEPAAGRTRIGLAPPARAGAESEDVWYLSHPLFTVPLAELLKRRGLFSLHAAGVARHGRALLLAGTSGAGKSTLAVALAQAGLDLLGDDTLFLAPCYGSAGLRLLAFPDEIDVTAETVGLLPEIAPHLRARPGWQKRQLAGERLGGRLAWECRPAVLVFPRVAAGREESRLTPLDPFAALLELAPNVLLTEPRSSQAHLDALGELAQASRCYRLETGRDLSAAAAQLAALLA